MYGKIHRPEGLEVVNMKVLVTGDPGGNLPTLFKRVAAVNKSHGPLLCPLRIAQSTQVSCRSNPQDFLAEREPQVHTRLQSSDNCLCLTSQSTEVYYFAMIVIIVSGWAATQKPDAC